MIRRSYTVQNNNRGDHVALRDEPISIMPGLLWSRAAPSGHSGPHLLTIQSLKVFMLAAGHRRLRLQHVKDAAASDRSVRPWTWTVSTAMVVLGSTADSRDQDAEGIEWNDAGCTNADQHEIQQA